MDYAAPLKGLFAGITGTVAMTLALRRVFPRFLPPSARRGLLPQRVVEGVERQIAGRHRLGRRARRVATIPAHYGYGATMGLGYGVLRAAAARTDTALLGSIWGLVVWAGSYQGYLPAAGIVPRTTDRPPRQWIVPIGSHLVYGIATAFAFEALSAEPQGDRT